MYMRQPKHKQPYKTPITISLQVLTKVLAKIAT